MNPNRLFILIAALAALFAGTQTKRQDCATCVLLPKAPLAPPVTYLNSTTPKP